AHGAARPGHGVGAVRCHAGRRDRARHLLLSGKPAAARHAALTYAASGTWRCLLVEAHPLGATATGPGAGTAGTRHYSSPSRRNAASRGATLTSVALATISPTLGSLHDV